jgi:hypothetical protein
MSVAIKKKKTQADHLAEAMQKVKKNPKSMLATRTAELEEKRVIDQFINDFDIWVEVNTIEDEYACEIREKKGDKHNLLYDEKNNVTFYTATNGYEVGVAAYEAKVPRMSDYRYIFSITHDIYLDSKSVDIHHLDGNHKNNSPYNLLALPRHVHHLYENEDYSELNEAIEKLIKKTNKG